MIRHLGRRGQRGQAMVEFALTASLSLLVILGTVDFGLLYASRIMATNAAASAARYAAANPNAWSNASTPAAASIQGKLVSNVFLVYVPNDDGHVTITYKVPGTGSGTTCGTYSASSGGFVAQNGYTQATCLVSGTVITVSASYVYVLATPVLYLAGQNTPGISVTVSASAPEEQ